MNYDNDVDFAMIFADFCKFSFAQIIAVSDKAPPMA
jgi:hypothetical protein